MAYLVLSPSLFLPYVPVFLDVVHRRHPQRSWIKWRRWNLCPPGSSRRVNCDYLLGTHSDGMVGWTEHV